MQFSLDTVRAVTRLLHESDLAEISLETTDNEAPASRLTVRRQPPSRAMRRQASAPLKQSGITSSTVSQSGTGMTGETDTQSTSLQATNASTTEEKETVTVSATAVGMFRRSQPPLKIGDSVILGQVVGIVESLKIPNEVIAPVAGEVTEILAEEGQAVEYGQSLFLLGPSQ